MGLLFAEMFQGRVFGEDSENQTKVGLPEEARLVENIIWITFAVETFVRLVVMGPCRYFRDALCVIDFTVSAIDISLYIIALEYGNDMGELSVVRMLRVSRLSKISRIARLTLRVDDAVGNNERGEHIETDEDGHIYEFNSATLFSLGWMYNLAGTVIVMPEIWTQCLLCIILTTLLAVYTCPPECDPLLNTFDGDYSAENCVGTDELCFTSLDPNYGLMFLGLAAFLLGIFAQLLFDRWWNMRCLIEELFSEIKDMAMMTSHFLTGTDAESNRYRSDVIRWGKLAAYLLEKGIDGKDNYRGAINSGLMLEEEWDALEQVTINRYIVPQQWAFSKLCEAKRKGIMSDDFGGTIDSLLTSFLRQRTTCENLLMVLQTPIPYVFLHLMTIICKVNLLFTSLACGTVVGQARFLEQWITIIIGYLTVILGNMLIEGLLRLHVVLSDPFGDDPCDFPWQMMFDKLCEEVETMENSVKGFRMSTMKYLLDQKRNNQQMSSLSATPR
jgi:hypothetical protein